MGTAGLNVEQLTGMLQRMKVNCVLIDGDESQDRCVLRLSSIKRPDDTAIIKYENQGVEPRLVEIKVESVIQDENIKQSFCTIPEVLHLRGARIDDPKRITQFIEQKFLGRCNAK